ncbi:hypothetical protein GOBAR_AA14647 [Gossypium barbadense]|uniref:Piwi domain-containing protein n=1 Tax=Gossypium barbadense TaxID=3634 RepID=A0A2P5XRQ4_GOSBA|nr:hypothetical protein GOBAR_AA14647 [Gossypium barbadense]
MLTLGQTPSIPVVSKVPTIILGMGALFGFPEQSDVPSTAAMVSSRWWPLISSYGASAEAFLDFYTSSRKRKPDQIIIFRDGVSESQFNQVLIKLLRLATQGSSWTIVLHGTIIDNKYAIQDNGFFTLVPMYWNDWNHEADPLSCSLRPGWVFG